MRRMHCLSFCGINGELCGVIMLVVNQFLRYAFLSYFCIAGIGLKINELQFVL